MIKNIYAFKRTQAPILVVYTGKKRIILRDHTQPQTHLSYHHSIPPLQLSYIVREDQYESNTFTQTSSREHNQKFSSASLKEQKNRRSKTRDKIQSMTKQSQLIGKNCHTALRPTLNTTIPQPVQTKEHQRIEMSPNKHYLT